MSQLFRLRWPYGRSCHRWRLCFLHILTWLRRQPRHAILTFRTPVETVTPPYEELLCARFVRRRAPRDEGPVWCSEPPRARGPRSSKNLRARPRDATAPARRARRATLDRPPSTGHPRPRRARPRRARPRRSRPPRHPRPSPCPAKPAVARAPSARSRAVGGRARVFPGLPSPHRAAITAPRTPHAHPRGIARARMLRPPTPRGYMTWHRLRKPRYRHLDALQADARRSRRWPAATRVRRRARG